ncbi:ATP-binding protein [Candidatus Venteria ishoeyi]|uniref:histidine kinase n=1 Tax=Candidatus Venteria ishoeyi TaxID=1899563 RepID=A0A1H6FIA8_9GAMM|nr:ATP-binding protein [Candidatus Venteria ishoeyi]MDM8547923.1 ATP-binding protein [Candidatus Venteria ishoeyi]SEH08785.1 Sensor protein kinase WalK [Candidatus Venteria ishoeyi]
MSLTKLIYRHFRALLMVLLFGSLLASLWMLTATLENPERFPHLYTPLLIVSSLGLVGIGILILLNLRGLVQQIRKDRAGARLTLRLVIVFVLLTIIPLVLVYYFSLSFIHQRLDNWFDTQLKASQEAALELSRLAFQANMRDAYKRSQQMSEQLSRLNDLRATVELNRLRETFNAVEVSLYLPNGKILAFSSADTLRLLPNRSHESSFLPALPLGTSYTALEPIPDRGLYIQVMFKYNADIGMQKGDNQRLFSAWFETPEALSRLANEVEARSAVASQQVYLRASLTLSFTLVLSLVTLLGVLAATWSAFFAARQLVRPIRNLAEGTQAVADGNYDKQLPSSKLDELGFLVQSFNQMTRSIKEARDAAKRSQEQADARLAYLEIVLERMSSGVLSLDTKQRLRTSNHAADRILGISMNEFRGQSILDTCSQHSSLQTLCENIAPHLHAEKNDWQEEVVVFGTSGRKILICRGAALPVPNKPSDSGLGHVIVFDDMTGMIQAQRDEAWSEVARRLAHEIKNPLTPIRLSAERLRHKYLPSFPDKEAQTLDRMTQTIITHVESMKEMLDAFSNYARSPEIHLKPLQLNQLVEEVLILYAATPVHIDVQLSKNLPEIKADSTRLRQVLHNLIKNALEMRTENPELRLTSCYQQEQAREFVELKICDNGPGIAEEKLTHIFEPYVTSKSSGSGLGLAIVKKIIEEHGGLVWMENRSTTEQQGSGVCVTIRLPILETPHYQPTQSTSESEEINPQQS